MIKIWQLFLSSILISSFTFTTTETFDQLLLSSLVGSPFHPDIKIATTANETLRQEGNLKNVTKENYFGTTEIEWTNYANNWEQFKKYYRTITLYGSGYVDGKGASKKEFTNVNIAVADIATRDSWHDEETLRASGSKYCLAYTSKLFTYGSYNQAGVYYDSIVSGSKIKLRFYLWTKVHQVGIGSIWTEAHLECSGGIISSSWNLQTIKDSLKTALANQINLSSNYSGSLEDKRNIIDPTGKGNDQTTLLNGVIAKVLGNEFDDWKQYIQPYSFSNAKREATIVFKFLDPITKEQQVWVFHTPINITLSHDYWGKSLSERLHIMPGQIVNPKDSTKGMVLDVGIQLEPDQVTATYGGNIQYHTTAHIEFDGMEDSSEWMTVNGEPVEVLNNRFIFDMVDNRVKNGNSAINVYDIVVYHDDGNYQEQYRIKYTINNLVPTLEAKWYAWNPEKNPEQKKLIEPMLPNGKPNPDYDREINPKTGTKTQIIWVKQKSQYPFPLDPLDKNGEIINPKQNPQDYDLGFIAEGSVTGMGVRQLFNVQQVKSVFREAVDNSLNQLPNPNNKQKLIEISSDSKNKYWSWQGIWHYITKTADKLAYEKYVLIGAKYQNKYPRFLDVLADSNVAVDFWTTIHGVHLKNYLAKYQNLISADISKLSYEQVVSFWKEYTSDIVAQRIPPNPSPINYQDLSKISFTTIKMNLTTVDLIKQEIIKQVKEQLASPKLIYQQDYQLKPFDNQTLNQLLNYDQHGRATITLTISALAISTRAIGTNSIKIINNIHYNPKTVIDLNKILFTTRRFNFSSFTVEQLKAWILQDISQTLVVNKISLNYPDDYGVKPLDEVTLKTFLTSKKLTKLTITIYAQDDSIKTKGKTTLILVNDPDSKVAPPVPPNPKPLPDDQDSWIVKQANLIIMSVIVAVLISSLSAITFFKYRFKKGIGGKKIKKISTGN